jgi:hypothetical protein
VVAVLGAFALLPLVTQPAQAAQPPKDTRAVRPARDVEAATVPHRAAAPPRDLPPVAALPAERAPATAAAPRRAPAAAAPPRRAPVAAPPTHRAAARTHRRAPGAAAPPRRPPAATAAPEQAPAATPPAHTSSSLATLAAPRSATFTRQRSVWDDLAKCESSGNWHIDSGNSFYGGLQFWQPTWRLFGGTKYARRADLASPQHQIDIAEAVLRAQGWSAWPVCSRHIGMRGFKHLVHTVKPGETLAGIARSYDVDGGWKRLYRLNEDLIGENPEHLHAGDVLTL